MKEETNDKSAKSAQSADNRNFRTTLAHSLFALVTSSFVLFELLFLWLFSDTFWFAVNIGMFYIPLAVLCMAATHLLLSWVESAHGCRIFSPIFHGLPPVVYRRWVRLDDEGFPPGIRFGNRGAQWSAIDEVKLTFFGNLHLLSRTLSGPPVYKMVRGKSVDINPPSVIYKIPFGVAGKNDQKRLIAAILQERPDCVVHPRLSKELEKPEPPGSAMVLNIVSIALALFFLDVTYSTLSYLEMLKDYYLCQKTCNESHDLAAGQKYFAAAEELRLHPLPSFVTQKMFRTAGTKSGIMQTRADALWALNKKEEAVESEREALEEHSKNFRAELKLARMLVKTGKGAEAYKVLDAAAEKAKKAFVPRLYYMAMLKSKTAGSTAATKDYYDQSTAALDKELFKDIQGRKQDWPPGVTPYLPDVWHREDVDFIMTRLLDLKPEENNQP